MSTISDYADVKLDVHSPTIIRCSDGLSGCPIWQGKRPLRRKWLQRGEKYVADARGFCVSESCKRISPLCPADSTDRRNTSTLKQVWSVRDGLSASDLFHGEAEG